MDPFLLYCRNQCIQPNNYYSDEVEIVALGFEGIEKPDLNARFLCRVCSEITLVPVSESDADQLNRDGSSVTNLFVSGDSIEIPSSSSVLTDPEGMIEMFIKCSDPDYLVPVETFIPIEEKTKPTAETADDTDPTEDI